MATAIKAIENCLIWILHKRLDSNESLVGMIAHPTSECCDRTLYDQYKTHI
ncbi:hypothetical protein [Nostoc sp. FACHB-190]|uniref:hypothetical protein n=1 Tax=Nostoc sp. FACHB-190 TaxID=2692838 RepID=UPI0016884542|nr:hypothetical protein [Nostoc sp. FACHB-190]MBD2300545.1 hypothetical protein [Nostoc sp. FACHB-190]